MHTPRNYQALRSENARATEAQINQKQQPETPAKAAESGQEAAPEKHRQARAPSPGWDMVQNMDHQQASAVKYNNWVNANAAERQATQPNISANVAANNAAEKAGGRERLNAALKEARESTGAVENGRDTGRSR